MVKLVTVLLMGFVLSILLTALYSFSAAFAGPEDPRLLETANISGTSENLTESQPEDPRLLETANISGTSENLTESQPEDPRLLQTP